MPKLSEAGTTRKISVYEIIETGNVRANYTDIEDLAASIKKNTLLEPILVKKMESAPDGEFRYELIAGHRRLLAHKYLIEKGDDFSMIEAKIVTGDKLTLQLVENLQRSDLTPRDREKAIYEMSQIPGVSQKDIASQLSKSEVYVSRQISAHKVRRIAEKEGYDTASLETSVMSEIQTVLEKDVPYLIDQILKNGGTVATARAIMRGYNQSVTSPIEPEIEESDDEIQSPEENGTLNIALSSTLPSDREIRKEPIGKSGERAAEIKAENPDAWKRETVPHKKVDLNDIFDVIYTYLTGVVNKIDEISKRGLSDERPNVGNELVIEGSKREAALDLISLIQKQFED